MSGARKSRVIATGVLVAMAVAGLGRLSRGMASETPAVDRVFLVAEVDGQRFVGETFCDRGRDCPLDIGRLDLARAVERYDFSARLDGTSPTRPMLWIGGDEIALRFEGGLHRAIPVGAEGTTTCASIQAGRPSDPGGLLQKPVLRSGTPIGWICIRSEALDPPR
jgi:hypothetical protein